MAPDAQQPDSSPDPYELFDTERLLAGGSDVFWRTSIEAMSRVAGAAHGAILMNRPDDSRWRVVSTWPAPGTDGELPSAFSSALAGIAERCIQDGHVLEKVPGDKPGHRRYLLGLRLQCLPGSEEHLAAAFLATAIGEPVARAGLDRLRAAAVLPGLFQLNTALAKSRADLRHFASALDLMVLLNDKDRYLAAGMTLCNELAVRHRCERVSLGWLKRHYVRLQAMSHTEKFEGKMAAVKTLELAMEESLNQDCEVLYPHPEDATFVSRDHETFGREQGVPFLCSVPLRLDGTAVGVITCERSAEPFEQSDVDHLRLCADQAVRRLADLKEHDRWFGARWTSAVCRGARKLIGVEHTGAKLIALLVIAAVLALVFVKIEYRVDASFVVRSSQVAHLPAPFDGFIERVNVEIGDVVQKGAPLITMDTRDIELDAAAAEAEQSRYLREAEKARADNALAGMRIAVALAEQARIRLERARFHLSLAEVTSPFDGIVVAGDFEDDLKERIGAPVRKGSVLLRTALLTDLYVEAEVDERDIDHISEGMTGEVAFASQPHLTFAVSSDTIEPMAHPKDRRNIFVVRCSFAEGHQSWFRPGMSGVCKLNAGKRTLLWIFTHRTVDFLRMLLWW